MNQAELFAAPHPIAQRIADAERHGQRITPCVRHAMYSWYDRKVTLPAAMPDGERLLWERVGILPSPCDCLHCSQPAVTFPPDDTDPKGYCICPCCSYWKLSGCTHWPDGRHRTRTSAPISA